VLESSNTPDSGPAGSAISTQPAAAAKLAALLDKLRSASARGRRASLAVVREMTNGLGKE
jgi:hypothetical protein